MMRRGITGVRHSRVVSIPRTLTRGRELVVLTREEYEQTVLRSTEMAEALRAVAEGEREFREGRTLKVSSLAEALRAHAKRAH